MNEDEKMELVSEGIRIGREHSRPSPETDKRLSILDEKFSNINGDLKDIKDAINNSTRWLIATLVSVVGITFSGAYVVGNWRGVVDEKIINIEIRQAKNINDITSVRESIRPTVKEEIDNFAKRNFESYNK